MRIVGGKFRNHKLTSPKTGDTRPALEMLRGALFDIIEADVPGARVLDCFAGTGSLGLEAISRGAAHVTFVERAHRAIVVLRKNVTTLGVEEQAHVVHGDACKLQNSGRFDLILLDPPFPIADDAAVAELVARCANEWLADDGLLVFRRPATLPAPPPPAGLRRLRERKYGDSLVVIDWKERSEDGQGLRALVTAGGTREAIDDVRVITNLSTGRLGAAIARALSSRGVQTTLLTSAPATAADPLGLASPLLDVVRFASFADLAAALETRAGEPYDLVLMAAAVSDYSPVPADGKLSSDADVMTVELRRNPKLLDRLRDYWPDAVLIGFKLTSGATVEERREIARRQNERARLDHTFVNDARELAEGRHPAELVGDEILALDGHREQVAAQLVAQLVDADPADALGPLREQLGEELTLTRDACVLTRLVAQRAADVPRALAISAARGRPLGPRFACRLGTAALLAGVAVPTADGELLRHPVFAAADELGLPSTEAPRQVGQWIHPAGVEGGAPFIEPEYRGRGLGDRVVAWLEARGLPLLDHADADLGSYYRARGHVEADTVGEWTRYTPPTSRDGVVEAASVCLYDPVSRRVLLGHRRAGGWPEHFAFPGGKLDEGESHLDAAVRELAEETGIRATTTPVARCAVHTWSEGYPPFRVTNFLILVTRCEAPSETPELVSEWVPVDELDARRPMAAGTRRVIWAYGLGRGGDAWLDRLEGC